MLRLVEYVGNGFFFAIGGAVVILINRETGEGFGPKFQDRRSAVAAAVTCGLIVTASGWTLPDDRPEVLPNE